ncbi:hypothetical protein PL9631_540006 [Planktothrix paucivesiculata PCC 9631]|uniref:Uncharacterized protein n=1 Tax=Planktothrix paucivesiculata PCC 9631 TaxID=671071 RepID=A0A7Z9E064_9CYAN|nr:hypothetical protein PL9631_540006 [Planktothrix paucivesiculata PCC 9631]
MGTPYPSCPWESMSITRLKSTIVVFQIIKLEYSIKNFYSCVLVFPVLYHKSLQKYL